MQLILRSPHVQLADYEREYLEKKIQHLAKYADRVADESASIHIDVVQTNIKTSDHKLRLQGTMHVPHAFLRVEVSGLTFEEALDLFVDKMKKQIERYKLKLHRRDEKGKWIPKSTLEEIGKKHEEEFVDSAPKIMRRKNYSDERPMHEEEAIEQMELSGHPFFAFYNIDKDCFSVSYKRHDGNYGMIEMHMPA